MSGSNLPKSLLSPPWFSEEKNDGESVYGISSVLRQTRYFEIVQTNAKQSFQEMHQNRIVALREELEYLKETEWKYEPIDKYIGQQNTYT